MRTIAFVYISNFLYPRFYCKFLFKFHTLYIYIYYIYILNQNPEQTPRRQWVIAWTRSRSPAATMVGGLLGIEMRLFLVRLLGLVYMLASEDDDHQGWVWKDDYGWVKEDRGDDDHDDKWWLEADEPTASWLAFLGCADGQSGAGESCFEYTACCRFSVNTDSTNPRIVNTIPRTGTGRMIMAGSRRIPRTRPLS